MSPSQQTLLTAAIAEIEGAEGRDGILRQALNAETESEANFLIKSVTMLAWYHIDKKPITAVMTYTAVPVGVSEDGTAAVCCRSRVLDRYDRGCGAELCHAGIGSADQRW